MPKLSLLRLVSTACLAVLTAGAGYLGYRAMRGEIAAAVYRDRLASLARDYEALRTSYNDAVRKSAVTELIVKNNTLSLSVRTPQGVVKKIETALNPRNEIYVDYVLVDGRLFIRRVYDNLTAPAAGVVLDPALTDIDWSSPFAAYGQAIYRQLTDGRWIVTVAGNGSLGLVRVGDADASADGPELKAAPQIKDYNQVLSDVDAKLDDISIGDVWRRVVGP